MTYYVDRFFNRSMMWDRKYRAEIRVKILNGRVRDQHKEECPYLTLATAKAGQKVVDDRYYIYEIVKVGPKSVVLQKRNRDGEAIGKPWRVLERNFLNTYRETPSEKLMARHMQLSRRYDFIKHFSKENSK